MNVTLNSELERRVQDLVSQGSFPNVETALDQALKALAREQTRQRMEALLDESTIGESTLMPLLREAADSGEYSEMTPADWDDIEREGLALLHSQSR